VPSEVLVHPWFLKQYNNRWFLFGYNEGYNAITNLPLDRILSFTEAGVTFRKNEATDFDEYFDDVVGVTVRKDVPAEKVLIRLNAEVWPYVESKPFHGSQRILDKSDTYVTIQLTVQVNHELMALLFSQMDAIEVIEPASLRARFGNVCATLCSKYL
jgi:predicted DNA-binding transcriptional regulator YafY